MKYRAKVVGSSHVRPALTLGESVNGNKLTVRGERLSASGVAIRDADLSGSRLLSFYTEGSIFERCDFSDVVFSSEYESSLSNRARTEYVDCSFDGADLRHTDVGQARFVRCSFRDARIVDWRSEAGEFVGCVFAGPMREAIFFGYPPEYPWNRKGLLQPARMANEFQGNDFRAADLWWCEFRNRVDLDAQLLPVDERYLRLDRSTERFQCLRLQSARWTDPEMRSEAERLIAVFGGAEYDQEDWFVRRENLGSNPVRDELIAVLRGC